MGVRVGVDVFVKFLEPSPCAKVVALRSPFPDWSGGRLMSEET
jgi:hypothetical protein